MDPITAWALALKAMAEFGTEVVKGQPPEFKAEFWRWWAQDVATLRKLLKLDA